MPIRKLWPEVQVLFDLLTVGETARPFDHCDHCIDPRTMDRIQSTPPRELDDNQLSTLRFNLMATAGDASPDAFSVVAERLKQNTELYLEFADDEALWHDHDLLMEVLDFWDKRSAPSA